MHPGPLKKRRRDNSSGEVFAGCEAQAPVDVSNPRLSPPLNDPVSHPVSHPGGPSEISIQSHKDRYGINYPKFLEAELRDILEKSK